jgi:hypothetical protein
MAEVRDLDQIEYRHHQTRDLSPVASSLPSPDALHSWDARIRPWVRHPHSDRPSESTCYQIFPTGHAALAWRYWDQRAVERPDGTRGRPLVSRVLAGPQSLLTPDVAMALCRKGPTADSIGLMPGEVPEGSVLPPVSDDVLAEVVGAVSPGLDRAARHQQGLQALVAAALSDPQAPLAISIRDELIQKPLRDGIQGPMLWGLYRVIAPLLRSEGRGWSFSTFEPPLGEMDPASLPSIVFRQAKDATQTPPARWRKEIRIRPLAADALDATVPYAALLDLAGRLVDSYHEHGPEGLEQFIARCCGPEPSLRVRLQLVHVELGKARRPARDASKPAQTTVAGRESGPLPARVEREPVLQPEREPVPEPEREPAPAEEKTAPPPASTEVRQTEWPTPQTPDNYRPLTEPSYPWPEEAVNTVTSYSVDPAAEETRGGGFRSPDESDEWTRSLAPSREGRTAPRLPLMAERASPPYGQSAATPAEWDRSSGTVTSLLKQLELVGDDPEVFHLTVRKIFQAGRGPGDANDRARSWEVLSNNDWYSNIAKYHEFLVDELAEIFYIVVIPELSDPHAAQSIPRWAGNAPSAMIGGLLAGARRGGDELWQFVVELLTPVLAARWATDHMIQDQWHRGRVGGPVGEPPGHDDRRSVFSRFRWH